MRRKTIFSCFHIRFLIPRGAGEDDICWASIIDNYYDALDKDGIKIQPEDAFFKTGRAPTAKLPSKFLNTPIGHNQLGNIGKHIATYLNLPNPDAFTGHCFRR